jgi:intraflagellar transport protein 88
MNRMFQEALATFSSIVKNKQFNHSHRLRVNMGNIYYDQAQYQQAVKMYRMALDQIPSTHRELKYIHCACA